MATAPKSRSNHANVAVVTVSYGSEEVLGDFLQSLSLASTRPLQVIVADNKAVPASPDVARISRLAGAEYLPLKSNRGYGHAVNAAVQGLANDIEWVLVSNPDIVASPGAIDMLVEHIAADPSIGAIGPRILTSSGEVYPSARGIPSLRTGIGHGLFANLWPTNPWTRRYLKADGSDLKQRDAGWLSGAFLLVRRSVLDELDGFDEGYFMYFEDVDLGYRMGKRGLRNVYEPAAVVTHSGAHSTQGESSRMLRAHHVSAKRFLFKKYAGWQFWPLRVVLALGLNFRSWRAARHPIP
ncbi:glycosyltransferase family 2 protein [Cryobacterium sp. Y11]|uniref:glycosyltransferase family 2 protein n=1 Tax=Cryobacterium sp. Y11 TaxID=2045016 RepID=UPI000CE56056|nr:glycosyltransferase family 2 protein [Cryobacterium sp. Y11]